MFNTQSQSLSKSTQFSSLASLHFCDKKARDEAWGALENIAQATAISGW
jgi:hypothetical protein